MLKRIQILAAMVLMAGWSVVCTAHAETSVGGVGVYGAEPGGTANQLQGALQVSNFGVIVSDQTPNVVTFSFKVDVLNQGGTGNVFVKVIGKNNEGYELSSVFLSGTVAGGESRTLTGLLPVSIQNAAAIKNWDVVGANIY